MRIRCLALLCAAVLLLAGCGRTETFDHYAFSGNYDSVDPQTSDFYEGQFMVYALVPEGWGDVFLWAGAEGVSGMFPDFPGMAMAMRDDGWYAIAVDRMFDHIVISANGGAAVTELILCDGQDIRIEIGEASYTAYGSQIQTGVISAGGFSMPEIPGEYSGYDQMLEDMKQSDCRIVADRLEVMALLGYQEGIPVKMEYGYDSGGLKELSIQTYYPMEDMSDEEVLYFVESLRNLYQIEFSGYGCVQVYDELRDAWVVLVICCTGLEDPACSRTAAYLFGGNDILLDDDMVRMPDVPEAEAMGYYVKYY